jgi:hypothetical protein
MWYIDPLLGNDRKKSNYKTVIAKWWLRKQACFHGKERTQQQWRSTFYAVRTEML